MSKKKKRRKEMFITHSVMTLKLLAMLEDGKPWS
jgi:hypothetical protein